MLFRSSKLREVHPELQPVASGSGTHMDELVLPSATLVKKSKDELNREADGFARRGSTVRLCFSAWKKRWSDTAAWRDACRRSDAYKQKLHESDSGGLSQSSSFKRRRESNEHVKVEPARLRRRLKASKATDPNDPFTDDQRVRRLTQVIIAAISRSYYQNI